MHRTTRIVAAAALSLVVPRSFDRTWASDAVDCGPQVSRSETGLLVVPGGLEDTAALQCAIDAAIAAGRRTTIRLAGGTFHTAQLVAKGFVGELQGSGADATVLTNVERPVPVAPVDFYLDEPGPENPWPSLVAFVGGEFRVSDLTVRITGEAPTTGWSILGIDPAIKAFAHAFVVVGDRATAEFARLTLEGAPAPEPLAGLNLFSGIYFEGYLGPEIAPIAGRFAVHDCVARQLASPAPVYNLRHADVVITGNRFEGTVIGGEFADLDDVRYLFAGNEVLDAAAGVNAYDNCFGGSSVCGVQASSVTIAGNAIRAFDGVEIFSTIGTDVSCRIVGNDVDYDAANGGVAVWLGRHTRGCFVSTDGAVLDRGTDNRVVTHR